MSYAIEFDRQFIRSGLGITPLWLSGDNNVTRIAPSGREVTARNWSVFYNLLGTTEEKLLEVVKPSLGGYGEHWKKRGRWIDDAALLRWIHNGCKAAAPIEEILAVNCLRSVFCYLSVWGTGFSQSMELKEVISTTPAFDAWIQKAQQRISQGRANKQSIYPIVDFGSQPLKHPPNRSAAANNDEKVLIKIGTSYLSAMPCGNTVLWTNNIKSAHVFRRDEAMLLITTCSALSVRGARMVSAALKERPYNYVLQVSSGSYAGYYVYKRVKRHLQAVKELAHAKRYPNESEAKKAALSINAVFQTAYGMVVPVLIETNE